MKHLICSVGPSRFIIADIKGTVVTDTIVELKKFIDAQKEIKYINPVHSIAWSTLLELSRLE